MDQMRKILFLDIDGVLNGCDNMYSRLELWRINAAAYKTRDEYGDMFDERSVRWLAYIVEKTGCGIVISSTWRRRGLNFLQTMWEMRNLPGQIIDITPLCADDYIVNKYACGSCERGYEIQEWLECHDECRYCIVDDNDDMLPHQKFVKTNAGIGLDMKTANAIISVLNCNNE